VGLEAEPIVARVNLDVDGIGSDGTRLTISQRKDFTVRRDPEGWRIVSDAPTPMRAAPVPSARFEDETQLRGLWFVHETKRRVDPHGVPQRFIYGSGVAAFDFDNDGWTDAVLLSGDRIALFRNLGRGHFANVTEAAGLAGTMDGVLTSALPFDYDNDGWRDLFIGSELAQPLLFHNEGGRFVRVENSGIQTTERTVSAIAADFDSDGFADLYLANHDDVYWNAPEPPGGADNAQPDQLYRNNGDGTFRDATAAAGVGYTGWSLAPVAADYDRDGDVDIFVGNDFGRDTLYQNDGSGRFEEVASDAGVDLPVASMSADWGDFDGDGDFDLFVGGMLSSSAWVLEVPDFQIDRVPRIVDALFRPYVRDAVRAWFRGNRFYENLGDGTFREISAESGAQNSGWAWGTVFLDFDNDGRLDLYGANGFISGPNEDDV
jgi:hypothetical protein